jgi:hypothetical protein
MRGGVKPLYGSDRRVRLRLNGRQPVPGTADGRAARVGTAGTRPLLRKALTHARAISSNTHARAHLRKRARTEETLASTHGARAHTCTPAGAHARVAPANARASNGHGAGALLRADARASTRSDCPYRKRVGGATGGPRPRPPQGAVMANGVVPVGATDWETVQVPFEMRCPGGFRGFALCDSHKPKGAAGGCKWRHRRHLGGWAGGWGDKQPAAVPGESIRVENVASVSDIENKKKNLHTLCEICTMRWTRLI